MDPHGRRRGPSPGVTRGLRVGPTRSSSFLALRPAALARNDTARSRTGPYTRGPVSRASPLSPSARLAWGSANAVLGLVPSLAFFVWVERNARPPFVGPALGWPWISLRGWPVPGRATWDAACFLAFGAIHSLLAQARVQDVLLRGVPAPARRSCYLVVTGASLLGLMGCWQHTDVVVWRLPLAQEVVDVLSLTIFWTFLAAAGWVILRFDALEFLGFRPLRSRGPEATRSAPPTLLTSGIYGRIRHPIYTFTVLAFLVTPLMTLDRLVLVAATGLYLVWGIPMEERKLVASFGDAYEAYRARVPAVLPRLLR